MPSEKQKDVPGNGLAARSAAPVTAKLSQSTNPLIRTKGTTIKLRPAVTALIGAAAAAIIFGLVLAMVLSRPTPVAATPAENQAPRTVTVRTTSSGFSSAVVIVDPSGSLNLFLSSYTADDGSSITASNDTVVEVPFGGVVTVTVTPQRSNNWDSESAASCGIYIGNDPVKGATLSVHRSLGNTDMPIPTVCTWTNR